MLRPRVIACLLLKGKGLVKTIRFKDPTYVGDPINVVRILNEKEVDVLIVLDIDASFEKREPNYRLIEALAAECRMPFCYGGGIKSVDQIQRIIGLGVEKVALGSAAVEDPQLVGASAKVVGNQSIVVVIDVKKNPRDYEAYINSGLKRIAVSPVELARTFADRGAGEIVINSIDNDGMMNGYDTNLIESVAKAVTVPITALGGAGSLDHIRQLVQQFGQIGAAAGSLFTFKGQYRAVLINYPTRNEKYRLVGLRPA
jgi:cyclase